MDYATKVLTISFLPQMLCDAKRARKVAAYA